MEFVARNQSAEPLQPGEQPFHDPAALISAQWSAVLRLPPVLSIGRYHLDAVLLFQVPVQRIGIVRLVADQPRRQFVEEARGERFIDELALVRRGRIDRDSHRNAVFCGDRHDLRPLAPFGLSHCEAPFFADAKLTSIKASSRSSLPSSRSFSASTRNAFSNCPPRTNCWKRPCTVWYGGYLSGNSRHCAPVRRTQSTPFSTARVSAGGRPRPSARRGNRNSGSSRAHSSSDNSPRACIRASRDHQSCLLCPATQLKTQAKSHFSYLWDRFYSNCSPRERSNTWLFDERRRSPRALSDVQFQHQLI